MAVKDVLIRLNNLKSAGIIQDYAIAGGYAAMYYDVPVVSYDLDVLVVLSSENDYHLLYEHFRSAGARIENVYIYIEDMPVQFLPNYISPLYNSAIEEAFLIDFDGVESKFVKEEYLILMSLTAFRTKDRMRIKALLDKIDNELVLSLIKKFDDGDRTLFRRYREVLERT